jgi:hypothetical protein
MPVIRANYPISFNEIIVLLVGGNNAFFGITMGNILLPIWGTTLYNRK